MRDSFLLVLAFGLFAVWILSWLVFHVAAGLIHILVILAVVSLIVHFFRRRSA